MSIWGGGVIGNDEGASLSSVRMKWDLMVCGQ